MEVELVDDVDDSGEFTGLIYAYVTAAPLPEGVTYRSANIRFSIPGDYCDYKFRQGESDGIVEQLVNTDANPVGYYDVTGRQVNGLQKGLNIVKMSDGTARKIYIK